MNKTGKSVVITGASSGIGRACASRLTQSGWRVFATVRKSTDGDKLQSDFGSGVTPAIFDVTDHPTIRAATEEIASELDGRGLDGLCRVRSAPRDR
jgi:NAD(P)-dependent dehydrogenase (short-subunit alcohol dehydrogenase family)